MAKKINSKRTVVEVAEEPISLVEARYPSTCKKRWYWSEDYYEPDRFTVKSIKNCIKALDKIIATGGRNEFTAKDLGVPTQTLTMLAQNGGKISLLSMRDDFIKTSKTYVNVNDPNDLITRTRTTEVRFYSIAHPFTIEDVKKMREGLIQRFFTI